MSSFFEHRLSLRSNIFFMIAICLCVYFTYHTLQGERGIFKLLSLNVQVQEAQETLVAEWEDQEALQEKVVMLRPESLNADFLEERVAVVLGMRDPDKKIMIIR